MKLSTLHSLAALAGLAAAEDAYLWTVDHGAAKYANSQASSITSETASSIIARRRGILNDEHLTGADDYLLRDVKQYGGYQIPLSGTTPGSSPAKVFIKISGYTGTVSQFPSLPDLWVEDATKDLSEDFKARQDVKGLCEYELLIPTKKGVDLVYSYDSAGSACMSTAELQIQPTILALMSTIPTAEEAPKKFSSLMRTLSHLSVTSNLESTLLILPPTSKLHKAKSGRRTNAEPLEAAFASSNSKSSSTSTGKHSKTSSSSSSPTSGNTTLPRFIPQCFTSQESCDETTNACSGHGSCYNAHSGCYKCKCGTTLVRTNADGTKKTVQWGGNACQKKDISVEFVLFASLGVVLATIVFGAIGALYSMGSEDLPSVLGAGVPGSNKQK